MTVRDEPIEIRAIGKEQFDAALATAYRAFGTLPGKATGATSGRASISREPSGLSAGVGWWAPRRS